MSRVSVRQLAIRLQADKAVVRGIVIGLGVKLERTPAADFLTEHDARKVKAKLAAYRAAMKADAA